MCNCLQPRGILGREQYLLWWKINVCVCVQSYEINCLSVWNGCCGMVGRVILMVIILAIITIHMVEERGAPGRRGLPSSCVLRAAGFP